MKNAVKPSRKNRDDAPKDFEELSEKARKVYEIVRGDKRGERSTLNDDDRVLAIEHIKDRNRAYKRKLDRYAIDAELENAGLMYVDPETNKRVALPVYKLDDFFGEIVEAEKERPPAAATVENPPYREPSTPQGGIDAAPRDDISYSADRASKSQASDDDGAFPGFTQFDGTSDAPADDAAAPANDDTQGGNWEIPF